MGKRRTKLSVVRYGNVINSRGSLFEKFLLLKTKTKVSTNYEC